MFVSQISGYLAWLIVPRAASSVLQSLYYKVVYINPNTVPRSGSQSYSRDNRISYAIVIAVYLVYTVYKLFYQVTVEQGNFYSLLRLPVDVDVKTVKRVYRSLSLQYHPDKVGPGHEQIWLAVKTASETLSDPLLKFAYDRFGLDALYWTDCKTQMDFVLRGLRVAAPNYVVSGLFLAFFSFMQNGGSYVRCCFLLLFILMLSLYLLIDVDSGDSMR